jgi:predicted nucleic-acid-binding Zn-ribbon protein
MRSEKDQAYWERNQLVSYLSKEYEAWIEKHPSTDIAWDLKCAFGWYDIIRDLSNKIERILEKDAETYQSVECEENQYSEMYAVQIKEKYGILRYHMSCETDEIS